MHGSWRCCQAKKYGCSKFRLIKAFSQIYPDKILAGILNGFNWYTCFSFSFISFLPSKAKTSQLHHNFLQFFLIKCFNSKTNEHSSSRILEYLWQTTEKSNWDNGADWILIFFISKWKMQNFELSNDVFSVDGRFVRGSKGSFFLAADSRILLL